MSTDIHDQFPTPTPITLRVRNHAGTIDVIATDTTETTVDITSRVDDAAVVEMSRDGRTLTIEPRHRRALRHQGIGITVTLPVGSELHVESAAAPLRVTGAVSAADVTTASGSVTLDQVDGAVRLSTASGSAKVGRAAGATHFRSASGSLEADRLGGVCKANTASGSITVGVADDDVSASSVSGSVTVREAHRGTVDASATSGSVDVGVRRGTLVWLDVSSVSGRTRSDLATEDGVPGRGGAPLTVRARSVSGSVSITSTGTAPIAL